MKKFIPKIIPAIVGVTLSVTGAFADDAKKENIFFGEYMNQFTLNVGQGVNSFGLIPAPDMFVPFNMFQLQYAQPIQFFRLDSRLNFSVFQTIGYGKKYEYTDYVGTFEWDWSSYAGQIATLTVDMAFYHTTHWYYGAGIGMGMQGQQNEREGTKMLFSFKLFAGYKISDRWNAELFTQHFSNGDAGGLANYSYNFWGLGVGYNF